jgi:hypothetical protein
MEKEKDNACAGGEGKKAATRRWCDGETVMEKEEA